jgi:hypothetical protein
MKVTGAPILTDRALRAHTRVKTTAVADDPTSEARRAGRITDARGRRVKQLDPVTMCLLRQHSTVDADVLHNIAHERGVRITRKERALLIIGIVGALLVIGLFTHGAVTGDLKGAPLAKSSSLIFMCSIPWIVWYSIKRVRFGKVAAAMLKHLRCPHCGYDLRLLPTDPKDGATVCPECGCAWKLDDHRGAGPDVPGACRPHSAEENGDV